MIAVAVFVGFALVVGNDDAIADTRALVDDGAGDLAMRPHPAGGQAGARLAIAKGNAWIRRVFVIVVGALLARLAWQVVAGDS